MSQGTVSGEYCWFSSCGVLFLGYGLQHKLRWMGSCVIKVELILIDRKQFLPFPTKNIPQKLTVVLFVYYFTWWNILVMNNSLVVEEISQQFLHTASTHSCFHRFRRWWDLPMRTLKLSFEVISTQTHNLARLITICIRFLWCRETPTL